MFAEGFEYHLQDLTDDPVYCPMCGSCGEELCCAPTKCVELKCMYGEDAVQQYKDALQETNVLYNLLQETVDFFGFSVDESDDNYTDFLTLTEKLKKFVDITY